MGTTKLKSLQTLSVSVTEARDILAECRNASELKEVVARGSAAARYLRSTVGAAEAATMDAQEIHLWAARRLGEVLATMELSRGGRPPKETSPMYRGVLAPTLRELKLTHDKSSRYQAISRIPEEQFSEYLRWARHVGRLPSIAGAMQSHGNAKTQAHPLRTPAGAMTWW